MQEGVATVRGLLFRTVELIRGDTATTPHLYDHAVLFNISYGLPMGRVDTLRASVIRGRATTSSSPSSNAACGATSAP